MTVASWGFYPIVYMAPYTSLSGSSVETAIQIGYTLADLIAKVGVGCLIFGIALRKSEIEFLETPSSQARPADPRPTAGQPVPAE